MEIEGRELTNCEVSADGSVVRLGLRDASGAATVLKLPVDQAGALGMTLPSLIERALRNRYQDESLRYVHPLGSWALETTTDPGVVMVTLRTSDGFGVSFAMAATQREALGEALQEPVPQNAMPQTH